MFKKIHTYRRTYTFNSNQMSTITNDQPRDDLEVKARKIKQQLLLALTGDDCVTAFLVHAQGEAFFLINLFSKCKWNWVPRQGYKMESVAPLGGIWLKAFKNSNQITVNWTMDMLPTPDFDTHMDARDTDVLFDGDEVKDCVVKLRDDMKCCLAAYNLLKLSEAPLTLICKIKDDIYFLFGEWRRDGDYYVPKAKNKAILAKGRFDPTFNGNELRIPTLTITICNCAITIQPVTQFFDYRSPSETNVIDNYEEVYGVSYSFCIPSAHVHHVRTYLENESDFRTVFRCATDFVSKHLTSTVLPQSRQGTLRSTLGFARPSDFFQRNEPGYLDMHRQSNSAHTEQENRQRQPRLDSARDTDFLWSDEESYMDASVLSRLTDELAPPPRDNSLTAQLVHEHSRISSILSELRRLRNQNSPNDPPVENITVALAQKNLLELSPGVKEALENLDRQTSLSPKLPQVDATTVEDMIKQITCAVCMTNKNDAVTLPCNHNKMCYVCALTIFTSDKKQCPICRVEIKQVLQVYS